MWPLEVDKEQLSGQGGDLPLVPVRGRDHPPAAFGPGGEISLVWQIKQLVVTTDLQPLRVLLLLAAGRPEMLRPSA